MDRAAPAPVLTPDSARSYYHDLEHEFHMMKQLNHLQAVSPASGKELVVVAQTGTQAVDRAAALLVQVVEADDPQTFGELALAADLPKSTTSRLLNALERQGLLERDRDGAFRPGAVLARFARRGSSAAELIEAAQPVLDSLGRRTGETINLAIAGPDAVEQIAQVDSSYLLGTTNWVGLQVPFHCSALGKVFLAHGVVILPKGRLEARTARTLTTRESLSAELTLVLRRGYAVAAEELEPGLVALAAPVWGADGDVVAALSVSGPAVRLTAERVPVVAAVLVDEAETLSRLLGTPPNDQQQPTGRKEGAA
jgi:DNA-binding IclR family transcriptional regulator